MAAQDDTQVAESSPSKRRRSETAALGGLGGRYRSLFVLGKGGMGTVEAALEIEPASSSTSDRPDAYERVVALKRLLPDSAHDKRRVEMFLREARLAAMLDHPNVVRAFDYGEFEGELYLAMEYVEGQPLSRVLKTLAESGERLPVNVAAWILAEICRGLHAAHELADPTTGLPLQLVHRDVSPQNVMIGYDGRVRLLDFGVAKIESESMTKTGEVKGKTAYMSPEQAMGDRLDRRSDLFSVGAVLFECVALRRMWGDGTDMDVIRKLALESPPSLESAGAPLPKGLAELHGRLVAREAQHRPSSAIEVAGDLMAFVEDSAAAVETLRTILGTHFAAQARAQQERLAASLKEVAPEQADALRESTLPASAREALRASTYEAKPTAPVETKPTRGSGRALVAVALLGLLSLGAWKLATSTPTPTAPPAPTASASALTTPTSTATASATTTATPSASASTSEVSQKDGSAEGSGSKKILPPFRPSVNPEISATTRPRVVPSAKPTDLDEKPF